MGIESRERRLIAICPHNPTHNIFTAPLSVVAVGQVDRFGQGTQDFSALQIKEWSALPVDNDWDNKWVCAICAKRFPHDKSIAIPAYLHIKPWYIVGRLKIWTPGDGAKKPSFVVLIDQTRAEHHVTIPSSVYEVAKTLQEYQGGEDIYLWFDSASKSYAIGHQERLLNVLA